MEENKKLPSIAEAMSYDEKLEYFKANFGINLNSYNEKGKEILFQELRNNLEKELDNSIKINKDLKKECKRQMEEFKDMLLNNNNFL